MKFRQNAASTNASLAGKIDVNAGPNMNITFGASGAFASRTSPGWTSSLFNYDNYGQFTDIDWRAYGKFTQRFQQVLEEGETPKKGGVKNAYYTVMVDYSQSQSYVADNTHKDNYFNYGHLGKFEIAKENSYTFEDYDDNGVFDRVQDGVNDLEVTFTPSETNLDMAAITNQYFNLYDNVADNYENYTQLMDGGALLNGMRPTDVYGLWRNIGYAYNSSSKQNQSQFRVTAIGSADIGDHALSLGFEYEQRSDRYFGVSPVGLWTLMRQLTNSHTDYGRALDESQATLNYFGSFLQVDYATLNGAPGEFSGDDAQSYFDYNLRNLLKMESDGTEFINVDEINPSEYSLSMFSADELLNQGNSYVTYYGYDHAGDKIKGRPSFDDFFNQKDEYGNYTRPVGAFEPIYIAGYIMDKFAFDDLIFNVGVRIDRYDANQSVLKDQFLLYTARTIGEVSDLAGQSVMHPSSVPTNAIVYVNDIDDPTSISGYRLENQWYTSSWCCS